MKTLIDDINFTVPKNATVRSNELLSELIKLQKENNSKLDTLISLLSKEGYK